MKPKNHVMRNLLETLLDDGMLAVEVQRDLKLRE
jgi:hypothetical protein